MDPHVRNFRDFLQLYNKLTEMCFTDCTDNFFTRKLSPIETSCVDKCVIKFSSVNQKVMGIYVEAQTAINQRRLIEIEEQARVAQASAEAAAAASIASSISPDMTPPPPASTLESSSAPVSS